MPREFEVRVPKMGLDTIEVVVASWLVKEGDSVLIGAPLVELESEKTTFVLEAEAAGLVASIRQPQGTTVGVGEVLCLLTPE